MLPFLSFVLLFDSKPNRDLETFICINGANSLVILTNQNFLFTSVHVFLTICDNWKFFFLSINRILEMKHHEYVSCTISMSPKVIRSHLSHLFLLFLLLFFRFYFLRNVILCRHKLIFRMFKYLSVYLLFSSLILFLFFVVKTEQEHAVSLINDNMNIKINHNPSDRRKLLPETK